MTLTIEQLVEMVASLSSVSYTASLFTSEQENIYSVIGVLSKELHRRKHGPFTLAEAIASGRPFRRKGWASASGDGWVRGVDDEYEEAGGGYVWRLEFITVKYYSAGRVEADDITATDYELFDEAVK